MKKNVARALWVMLLFVLAACGNTPLVVPTTALTKEPPPPVTLTKLPTVIVTETLTGTPSTTPIPTSTPTETPFIFTWSCEQSTYFLQKVSLSILFYPAYATDSEPKLLPAFSIDTFDNEDGQKLIEEVCGNPRLYNPEYICNWTESNLYKGYNFGWDRSSASGRHFWMLYSNLLGNPEQLPYCYQFDPQISKFDIDRWFENGGFR